MLILTVIILQDDVLSFIHNVKHIHGVKYIEGSDRSKSRTHVL